MINHARPSKQKQNNYHIKARHLMLQRCWILKNQHLCERLVLCSLCCFMLFFFLVWYRVSWVTTWCLSPCQVHVPVKIYGNPAWTTIHSTTGNPLTRLQNLGTQAEPRRSHSKKLLCSLLLELIRVHCCLHQMSVWV